MDGSEIALFGKNEDPYVDRDEYPENYTIFKRFPPQSKSSEKDSFAH